MSICVTMLIFQLLQPPHIYQSLKIMPGTKLELKECELLLLSLFLIAGTECGPRTPDF